MTIEALRIANFKAFGFSQRVPLKPITLLFGANSSGKSTVLHALALAHHALEDGEFDTQRTKIGGESIDLGGFSRYVHRRDRERLVELGFELAPVRAWGRLRELISELPRTTAEVGIGVGSGGRHQAFAERDYGSSQGGGRASVERFALEIDKRPLFTLSARRSGQLRLDQFDHAHPVFRRLLDRMLTLGTTARQISQSELASLGGVLDELVPVMRARQRDLFPRITPVVEGEGDGAWADFLNVRKEFRREDLAKATRAYFPRIVADVVRTLSLTLDRRLRELHYLGPLRSFPPRHLAFSQAHDSNWHAGGGYAWDVVRTNSAVRERVNQWLGDAERLKTPYELRVRDLLATDVLSPELALRFSDTFESLAVRLLSEQEDLDIPEPLAAALDEVRDRLAHGYGPGSRTSVAVEDLVHTPVDADTIVEDWVKGIVRSRGDGLQDLVLIDRRSGTEVSHRDVGIGVSQVLPVLVSAYASERSLIAIEQPEIHLHPALQAELGDVFLESALGDSENRFLIETHSEHLILRILRRIRETSDGDLPKGTCPVKPEDVAVLYVQPGAKGAEVVHIPITPEGDFEQRWPDGFFADRAKELF